MKFSKSLASKEGLINTDILAVCMATISTPSDNEQLWNMSVKYRRAKDDLESDNISFVSVNAGGLKEVCRQKGTILAKKVLWLNGYCKRMSTNGFIRRIVDKENIAEMLQLADDFSDYAEAVLG